jgi:hypothetical protein
MKRARESVEKETSPSPFDLVPHGFYRDLFSLLMAHCSLETNLQMRYVCRKWRVAVDAQTMYWLEITRQVTGNTTHNSVDMHQVRYITLHGIELFPHTILHDEVKKMALSFKWKLLKGILRAFLSIGKNDDLTLVYKGAAAIKHYGAENDPESFLIQCLYTPYACAEVFFCYLQCILVRKGSGGAWTRISWFDFVQPYRKQWQ